MIKNVDLNGVERVQISNKVSKLGAQIPTLNFPAVLTCRPDAPCAKCGCYAKKGHWVFQSVKDRLMANLIAYKKNPSLFWEDLEYQSKFSMYFRYFSSGDIPDYQFIKGMCKVARKNPNTHYLCFTKRYEWVNQYKAEKHLIPKNLTFVFSTWPGFEPENPYNFPVTYVRFPDKLENKEVNKMIPDNAIPCSGSCATCQACWHLKKGQSVVFKKH